MAQTGHLADGRRSRTAWAMLKRLTAPRFVEEQSQSTEAKPVGRQMAGDRSDISPVKRVRIRRESSYLRFQTGKGRWCSDNCLSRFMSAGACCRILSCGDCQFQLSDGTSEKSNDLSGVVNLGRQTICIKKHVKVRGSHSHMLRKTTSWLVT